MRVRQEELEIEVNEDIVLRLFNLNFAEEYHSLIHEKVNLADEYRCHLQKKFPRIEDVKNRVEDAIINKYIVDGTPDFFIFYKDRIVGVFEFHPLTKDNHVEIGYWLFEEFRGNRILSAIFPKIIKFAGSNFDKSKIIASSDIMNIPSSKLLEKFSFAKTGNIHEYKDNDGEVIKEIEYSYSLRV